MHAMSVLSVHTHTVHNTLTGVYIFQASPHALQHVVCLPSVGSPHNCVFWVVRKVLTLCLHFICR